MESARRFGWTVGIAIVVAVAVVWQSREERLGPGSGVEATAPAPAAPPPTLAAPGRTRSAAGTPPSSGEDPAAVERASDASKPASKHVTATLRLHRSDGRPVDRATVRSADDADRISPWDALTSTVCLPEGRQTLEVLGGRFGEWRQPEDFAIEVREGMAPVDVTLRPWRMIVGHLRVADGGPSVRAAARLRAVHTNGEHGDDSFRVVEVELGAASDGWFCFGQYSELEPGEYELEASPWIYGPTRATARVTVRDDAAAVELDLPRTDPAEGVTLRVLGPDGRPHEPRLVTVDVRDEDGSGGGGGATTQVLGPGLFWVPTLLPGYSGKAPVEVTLFVYSAPYGIRGIDIPVKRSAAPVEVRFDDPAELRLTIENRSGWLRDAETVEAWIQVRNTRLGLAAAPIARDGTATLVGLQPGEVDLAVAGRGSARGLRLGLGRITLRTGENRRSISLPTLHALRIRNARGSLVIQATDGSGTFGVVDVAAGVPDYDAPALPAGSYLLRSGSETATVEIPAVSEVTLTEPPPK